eukprot:12891124-Prorocentrum_lima.AAC.1
MERGQLQLHLKLTGRPMQQLQGAEETQAEEAGGGWQGASDQGPYHESYQNVKIPAGPLPEQGFHDPINNFRPPPQGPEQH